MRYSGSRKIKDLPKPRSVSSGYRRQRDRRTVPQTSSATTGLRPPRLSLRKARPRGARASSGASVTPRPVKVVRAGTPRRRSHRPEDRSALQRQTSLLGLRWLCIIHIEGSSPLLTFAPDHIGTAALGCPGRATLDRLLLPTESAELCSAGQPGRCPHCRTGMLQALRSLYKLLRSGSQPISASPAFSPLRSQIVSWQVTPSGLRFCRVF